MFVSPKSYCNSQFYKRVWLTLMFVSPKPSGELRAFSNILSDAEDSEDVYSCIMMRKEASVLLSSLVGMIKIYQSDSSPMCRYYWYPGLVCTNGELSLRLYCSKILGALILFSRFRDGVEGFLYI